MKKIILIFSFISAVLQADEVVTRAIAKLIDENRAMRSEISILQLEAEKLETLQYNFKELNKELKELKKRLSILEKSDQHIVTRQPHKGTKAIITAQLLNVLKSPSFGDNILFLHSGGAFANFAFADRFSKLS